MSDMGAIRYLVSKGGRKQETLDRRGIESQLENGELDLHDWILVPQSGWQTISRWRLEAAPQSGAAIPSQVDWEYMAANGATYVIPGNQLIEALQSGRLQPDSLVRQLPEGDWTPAASVLAASNGKWTDSDLAAKSRFEGQESSRAMQDLIAECTQRKGKSTRINADPKPLFKSPTRASFRPFKGFQLVGKFLGNLAAMLVGPVVQPLVNLFRLRAFWGIVAISGILWGVLTISMRWVSHDDAYAELQGIWQEYHQLQDIGADSADWSHFQDRSRAQLEDLSQKLHSSAHAEDRRSILLLWIARDYLPRLVMSTDEDERIDNQIASHFRTIDTELNQSSQSGQIDGFLVKVVIAIDGILALAAVWYFRHNMPLLKRF